MIIGKRGKTLEALQLLVNIIFNKGEDKWKKIILDIENYRDKRESTLRELAFKVARKVKKTGKPQFLEPMNPFERRVIHIALQDDPHVDTRSEGSGNMKRVKVFLKRRKSRQPYSGNGQR
jgi:spoIIIJ-associated protein